MLTPRPGHRRRRRGWSGLGDTVCPDYPDTSTCYDTGTTDTSTQTVTFPPGYPTGTTLPSTGSPSAGSGGATPPATSTPVNWTAVIQSIITGTAKGVQLSQLTNMAPGSFYQQTPQGAIIASTAGIPGTSAFTNLTSSANLQGMMPILLVGGAVVVLMMMGARR